MKAVYALPANWPFRVNSLPFFYGWVIWLVSTLGIIFSIPGQTMGMAVFTNHFIEALELSRTQLSIAYLLGTLGGAVFLTRAGRFFDHAGARITIVLSSVVLGLCLLFISFIDQVSASLAGFTSLDRAWFSFPLILLGYFGVRFSGQGVLTSASRNVLLLWFERRRGLVSGARSVFVSLGFSLAAPFLAWLILLFGWRQALMVLALMCGIGFAMMALLFLRNSPQDCGLKIDGIGHDEHGSEKTAVPDKTAAEARRDPVFWIYASALALYSLFGTALVFHIESIFEKAGRSSEEAFAYFLPAAVVSVSTNLVSSWLADFQPLKRLLLVKLVTFIIGCWGVLHLQHDWGYYLLIISFGTTSGLWGVLSNLTFVRFFGRLHLGEISGINMTLTVIGSAIGPVMFSLSNDWNQSYDIAIWANIVLVALLLIIAVVTKQVEPHKLS